MGEAFNQNIHNVSRAYSANRIFLGLPRAALRLALG